MNCIFDFRKVLQQLGRCSVAFVRPNNHGEGKSEQCVSRMCEVIDIGITNDRFAFSLYRWPWT